MPAELYTSHARLQPGYVRFCADGSAWFHRADLYRVGITDCYVLDIDPDRRRLIFRRPANHHERRWARRIHRPASRKRITGVRIRGPLRRVGVCPGARLGHRPIVFDDESIIIDFADVAEPPVDTVPYARRTWDRQPGRGRSQIHSQSISGAYDDEVREVIEALDHAKRAVGGTLPWSGVFEVLYRMGYRRVAAVADFRANLAETRDQT